MNASSLSEAEATERALREQLADLVRARSRAEREARRLAERGTLAGADTALGQIAERYRAQGGRLGDEVEGLRTTLRELEARVERLRAEAAGA